jgi:hypothetical protein
MRCQLTVAVSRARLQQRLSVLAITSSGVAPSRLAHPPKLIPLPTDVVVSRVDGRNRIHDPVGEGRSPMPDEATGSGKLRPLVRENSKSEGAQHRVPSTTQGSMGVESAAHDEPNLWCLP